MFTTPCYFVAEGPGFEPGLTGPEPVVLPLDDPSIDKTYQLQKSNIWVKIKLNIPSFIKKPFEKHLISVNKVGM